ncbi:hypothetical protein AG1IA_04210 [Rhizoctonia solani AG-1 IA]|uniref:Uncharacterized protein n=1 Tax=Thanatephorus cucumeris (strain AG1-IA) TaxID=983506 RepID=L8WY65_THACA|nr:hypothetical protein AG1IA_04210 [Rhizoctonia solani AG-1 IA]
MPSKLWVCARRKFCFPWLSNRCSCTRLHSCLRVAAIPRPALYGPLGFWGGAGGRSRLSGLGNRVVEPWLTARASLVLGHLILDAHGAIVERRSSRYTPSDNVARGGYVHHAVQSTRHLPELQNGNFYGGSIILIDFGCARATRISYLMVWSMPFVASAQHWAPIPSGLGEGANAICSGTQGLSIQAAVRSFACLGSANGVITFILVCWFDYHLTRRRPFPLNGGIRLPGARGCRIGGVAGRAKRGSSIAPVR